MVCLTVCITMLQKLDNCYEIKIYFLLFDAANYVEADGENVPELTQNFSIKQQRNYCGFRTVSKLSLLFCRCSWKEGNSNVGFM